MPSLAANNGLTTAEVSTMSEAGRSNPAVLAVRVGPMQERAARAVKADQKRDQHARIVRAMLSTPSAREVDGPNGSACFSFDTWQTALDAAVAFLSQLRRLPVELAGIEVRIGLDLANSADDPAAAGRAANLAGSAAQDEIRLSPSLGRKVQNEPRDRWIARPVEPGHGVEKGAQRLALARDEVPTNLEVPATSFVGRETEIRELERLLLRQRLVTISGPPGAGKSRLASEVADRLLGRYEAGAWFVPLAPIRDPALVMSTIGDALSVNAAAGTTPRDALIAHLGPRRALVVLDNFEHLLSAGPELIGLLDAAQGLHLIVTSQTALGLADEHTLILSPLEVPSLDSRVEQGPRPAAVELFEQRAASAHAAFQIGPGNVASVVELCRRLDGLPLAIELAAARVGIVPLPTMLERLDRSLGLLRSLDPALPARRQSLHAAIAWSHDLLDTPAKTLFRRLAVFRGGWTLEAAAAISDDPSTDEHAIDALASLRRASLIAVDDVDAPWPRFAILETLRQFAQEALLQAGEDGEVRRLHADHYFGLATDLGPKLTGPDQSLALGRLAAEHDNIRAALTYLLESDPAGALRMAAAIWRFWQMRGHLIEGSRWVTLTLEAAAPEASPEDLASAHAAAGGLAYWRGDLAEAERHYAEAVALRRRIGAAVGIADALFDLAFVYDPSLRPPPEDRERTAAGIRIAEEGHQRYLEAHHEPGIAKSEWLLGSIVAGEDIDRARAMLGSSVARFRTLEDPFGLGWALHSYGLTLLRSVDSDAAATAFGEALRLFAAAGDGSAVALLLDDFVEVAKAEGDVIRAARLRGAASGRRVSTQAELAMTNAPWLFGDEVPGGLIDPAALERAWLEGRSMSSTAATAYALRSDQEADRGPGTGLTVRALGPLMVDRGGTAVSNWGGPKAGNRHALAVFAFLLDRGERGVSKDEFIEVLWPDAQVEQGDLNFHRTLGGLRTTLGRDRPIGAGSGVAFANGRYRLEPEVVGWFDVGEFQDRLRRAAEATNEIAAIRGLESARALYRGDYLDDCPLYGDSEYVEERRTFLRGRLVDALVDLGHRYESRHDQTLASERYREALNVSGGDCPSASDGLGRLGVAIA